MPEQNLKNNSKFKILFLGKLPPPFIGPAIAAKIIINSYLKEKYALLFFDISYHKDLKHFGSVGFASFIKTLKHFARFFKTIIKVRPDVVYIPSQQDAAGYLRDFGLIIIAKLFRVRVICHLRGGNFKNWYDQTSFLMKWIVKWTQKRIDAQIVLGENLRFMFDFLMSAEKIFVIPNGGNYHFPEITKDESVVKIVFLSNFIRTKGILDLVEAGRLLRTDRKVEFVFAGEAKEKDVMTELKSFADNFPEFSVSIVESVDEKTKTGLLKQSDIFVFPTYYPFEGHPWVIIEAMAAGLPVISTNHAAIPEAVEDGINGFLVKKNNPADILEKLSLLIENDDLRKKMSIESRRIYEHKFTEEIMISKLDHVFEFILKNKS